LWFFVEWAITLIDKIAENRALLSGEKVMSKETANQRRALSILFLIGSIFLVAAMWNLPTPECNPDDARRLKDAAMEPKQ
jgi:hypothetical protein